jgi:hypothetical protein
MAKCVICGSWFKDAMVTCPRSDRTLKDGTKLPGITVPKEICDECARVDSTKFGTKYDYDCHDIRPYAALAGRIEKLVLDEYRDAYEKALNSAYAMNVAIAEPLTEDEIRFRALHRQVTKTEGSIHYALTMGNIESLLDSTRREVERHSKAFFMLKKRGYNIFDRKKQEE